MSWKMTKVGAQKLTRSLAREFADMPAVPNDRPLQIKRTVFLREEVAADRFRTCEWASVFCHETGETIRVNGKHTSFVFNGLDTLPPISIIVERYECDTLSDAAQLYATFDARESSRTMHDINIAFAATIPALAGIRNKVVDVCVHGMAYAKNEDRYHTEHTIDRAQRLEKEADFVVWASQFMSIGGPLHETRGRPLTRGPVAAAMYRTYKMDKVAATEFWSLVRDETASVTDPTRTLARYLLTATLNDNSVAKRKAVTPRELYVKAIHAWNAWCVGERTMLRYVPDADTPKVLSPKLRKKVG